eukprot:1159416-Pelagomonas_calceolata.AAC.18
MALPATLWKKLVDMVVLDVQFMKLPGWSCAAPCLQRVSVTSESLILRSTQCDVEVLLLLLPARTMCYAVGTAPHRGPVQLPALGSPINRVQTSGTHKAWATVGGGTAAARRPLQEHQWKSCDITCDPSGCWWDLLH